MEVEPIIEIIQEDDNNVGSSVPGAVIETIDGVRYYRVVTTKSFTKTYDLTWYVFPKTYEGFITLQIDFEMYVYTRIPGDSDNISDFTIKPKVNSINIKVLNKKISSLSTRKLEASICTFVSTVEGNPYSDDYRYYGDYFYTTVFYYKSDSDQITQAESVGVTYSYDKQISINNPISYRYSDGGYVDWKTNIIESFDARPMNETDVNKYSIGSIPLFFIIDFDVNSVYDVVGSNMGSTRKRSIEPADINAVTIPYEPYYPTISITGEQNTQSSDMKFFMSDIKPYTKERLDQNKPFCIYSITENVCVVQESFGSFNYIPSTYFYISENGTVYYFDDSGNRVVMNSNKQSSAYFEYGKKYYIGVKSTKYDNVPNENEELKGSTSNAEIMTIYCGNSRFIPVFSRRTDDPSKADDCIRAIPFIFNAVEVSGVNITADHIPSTLTPISVVNGTNYLRADDVERYFELEISPYNWSKDGVSFSISTENTECIRFVEWRVIRSNGKSESYSNTTLKMNRDYDKVYFAVKSDKTGVSTLTLSCNNAILNTTLCSTNITINSYKPSYGFYKTETLSFYAGETRTIESPAKDTVDKIYYITAEDEKDAFNLSQVSEIIYHNSSNNDGSVDIVGKNGTNNNEITLICYLGNPLDSFTDGVFDKEKSNASFKIKLNIRNIPDAIKLPESVPNTLEWGSIETIEANLIPFYFALNNKGIEKWEAISRLPKSVDVSHRFALTNGELLSQLNNLEDNIKHVLTPVAGWIKRKVTEYGVQSLSQNEKDIKTAIEYLYPDFCDAADLPTTRFGEPSFGNDGTYIDRHSFIQQRYDWNNKLVDCLGFNVPVRNKLIGWIDFRDPISVIDYTASEGSLAIKSGYMLDRCVLENGSQRIVNITVEKNGSKYLSPAFRIEDGQLKVDNDGANQAYVEIKYDESSSKLEFCQAIEFIFYGESISSDSVIYDSFAVGKYNSSFRVKKTGTTLNAVDYKMWYLDDTENGTRTFYDKSAGGYSSINKSSQLTSNTHCLIQIEKEDGKDTLATSFYINGWRAKQISNNYLSGINTLSLAKLWLSQNTKINIGCIRFYDSALTRQELNDTIRSEAEIGRISKDIASTLPGSTIPIYDLH